MTCWWPTHCRVTLTVDGSSAAHPGTGYTGQSRITYERLRVPPTGGAGAGSAQDEETRFWEQVRSIGRRGGLHLHALTSAVPPAAGCHEGPAPLQCRSYRLSAVDPYGASVPVSLRQVVADDGAGEGAGAGSAAPSDPAAVSEGKRGKEKEKVKKGAKGVAKPPAGSSGGSGAVEKGNGSKIILFDCGGGEAASQPQPEAILPVGSLVELVVQFTGTVQDRALGGIHTEIIINNNNNNGGSGSGSGPCDALLTHFEVDLARSAFPCPDDPLYRLKWQLELNLPAVYTTVLSNGGASCMMPVEEGKAGGSPAGMSGKDKSGVDRKQGGLRRHTFDDVGPLPAYLLGFFACCGPVQVVEGEVDRLQSAAIADAEADTATTTSLTVLARAEYGPGKETLQWVYDNAAEALRRLEDFFTFPVPLLGAPQLTIGIFPMVPFLGGMEHHGLIFLNESVFPSCGGGRDKATDARKRAGYEDDVVMLLVHELAHHWVGNALGLPFGLKEGICLLLERWFGNAMTGRRERRLKVGRGGGEGGGGAKGAVGNADGIPVAQRGKELTGKTYQEAQKAMMEMVEADGMNDFGAKMAQVMRRVLGSDVPEEAEERGGAGLLGTRLGGSGEGAALWTYMSTTSFRECVAPSGDGSWDEE